MAKYNQAVPIGFCSPLRFAKGFDSFSDIPQVIGRLGARGYKEHDIAGILGENLLRVFEQACKPIG